MSTIVGKASPLLRMAGITKRFGGTIANDAIDLDLNRGEIVGLLGENGAGKTTLMNVLFGHLVPDTGAVVVADAEGRAVSLPPGSPGAALRAGVGMVHQHFTLADNFDVIENVGLGTQGLWSPWLDRARVRRRLMGLIDATGLDVRLNVRIGDLSIGERQRVELLKALYRGARVLILDEPTTVLTPLAGGGLGHGAEGAGGAGDRRPLHRPQARRDRGLVRPRRRPAAAAGRCSTYRSGRRPRPNWRGRWSSARCRRCQRTAAVRVP